MVGTKTDRRARAEHLFRVVSSDRFLQKQGLGNEVPFFICAFDAEDGLSLGEDREDLIARPRRSAARSRRRSPRPARAPLRCARPR